MLYPDLKFPKKDHRPFFYSNFAMTLDGKVAVKEEPSYQPLGSKLDYETLVDLRLFADCLIHGKETALLGPTLKTLGKEKFQEGRKKLKKGPLTYVILSNHPGNDLMPVVSNPPEGVKVLIVTNEEAVIPKELLTHTSIIQLGKETVDLQRLSTYLFQEGNKTVLLEGGPHAMGGFFKERLVDEVFITLVPKIIGNDQARALTMVEGKLFSPEEVKKLKLISCKDVEGELYLRYRIQD